MPYQIRSVEYRATGVNDLNDLLEMMRHDGLRFPATSTCAGIQWQQVINQLAKRSLGMIEPGSPDEFEIPLIKDQGKGWEPTYDRWRSFQMTITKRGQTMITVEFNSNVGINTYRRTHMKGQGITLFGALADLERRLDAYCTGGPAFISTDPLFIGENGFGQLADNLEYQRNDPGDDREDYTLTVQLGDNA